MSSRPADSRAPGRAAGSAGTGGAGRVAWVDIARGVAILAVVGYHLTWDLGDLGFIDTRIAQTTWGAGIARTIAGSFLFLVGVSLVLAHGRGIRHGAFWRRQAQLIALAVVVSVATWIAFPHAWVSFGILHCIVVAGLLALGTVRAPRWVPAAAALACVAAYRWIDLPGRSRWLAWTGLTDQVPETVDHAPVLPLLALTFLGVFVAGVATDRGWWARLPQQAGERAPGRQLAFLGRHTLAIYMLHQLVLLGVLHAVLFTGWSPR